MSKAEGFAQRVSDTITAIAFAVAVIAVVLTLADIVLRLADRITDPLFHFKAGLAVPGLVDLTQLLVLSLASLSIAVAFFRGAHVRVDLIVANVPPFWQRLSGMLAAVLGAALMGACLWTGWNEMIGQLSFTTTSATLGIPYTYYWLPLLAGLALSVLACAYRLVWPLAEPDHPNL